MSINKKYSGSFLMVINKISCPSNVLGNVSLRNANYK